jgi:hypothetical protein
LLHGAGGLLFADYLPSDRSRAPGIAGQDLPLASGCSRVGYDAVQD